jgi:septal ring factor EnvC (AmiA/AmiB activator)
MIELINSIPTSVWLLINAVLVSIVGVYFSRKKTAASVADLITQGAERNIEVYEKRLAQLEGDAGRLKHRNTKLEQRIASVEHDVRVYSEALHDLETQHEALQVKMRQWNEGIQILIKQVERHDSKPDWRPNGE